MQTVELNLADIQAAADLIPKDAPVFMLNLLRFRHRADYRGRTDQEPCSGREAYHQRYRPVFARIAEGAGHKAAWFGTILARVVGPADEQWDEMAIVEYPTFATFQRLVEDPRYKAEADHHRIAALENWRLLATAKIL